MPIDVILAIDSSASMTETDPGGKRLDAARGFVMKMDPARDRVGLVSWDDDVDFSIPPTEEFARVLEAIGRVDSSEGTNLDRGLEESIDLLTANSTGSDERARFVVFLSDGDGDYTPSGRKGSQTERARDGRIVIYTIGLSLADSRAKKSLEDMAGTTGGRYFEACDSSALESIYGAISEEVINVVGRDVIVRYLLPQEVEAFGREIGLSPGMPATYRPARPGRPPLTSSPGRPGSSISEVPALMSPTSGGAGLRRG
jgi:Ca-activated chloride channel family protein